MLAGGLMLTALVNIAFGFGTSLAWFVFFWGLNGTLQVGGPGGGKGYGRGGGGRGGRGADALAVPVGRAWDGGKEGGREGGSHRPPLPA
jgi:hypothetical protein